MDSHETDYSKYSSYSVQELKDVLKHSVILEKAEIQAIKALLHEKCETIGDLPEFNVLE